MAEQTGYTSIDTISQLAVGDTVDISVPEASLIILDAGGGGSTYVILKRYSEMLEIAKLESENFKLNIELTGNYIIKIKSTGLLPTSVRGKVIRLQ